MQKETFSSSIPAKSFLSFHFLLRRIFEIVSFHWKHIWRGQLKPPRSFDYKTFCLDFGTLKLHLNLDKQSELEILHHYSNNQMIYQ